ncbi:unnamed protein product [Bursaphelenchus xylophilus]|uniref:(pine wood nematode) hypothetical protein n=1 Tax=Bursaphelenchus xylophilus TaxID=6326 RepID=A0A1I7ST64_BURXY|nr:unnamed protein product [Bursaphelenchus xylophilus]CAG9108697.1 unnamed protein product [Bursaphelenchus xylophilus]
MQSLVVFVRGVARQITGSVENATTSDVIQALAQADHYTGKFTLVVVDRTNQVEYFLRSVEVPFEVIRNLIAQRIEVHLEMKEVDPRAELVLPRSRSLSNVLGKQNPPGYVSNRLSTPEDNHIKPTQSEKNLPNINLESLNITRKDVENIILSQLKNIEEQKEDLARLSAEVTDKTDKEYLQLLRQRRNLRKTIEQLEESQWEKKRQIEEEKLDRLQTAIDAMAIALDNKMMELNDILRLQTQLTYQMKSLKQKDLF